MAIANINELKVGDNVCYVPAHGERHKYQEYTSALTNLRDLEMGWRD